MDLAAWLDDAWKDYRDGPPFSCQKGEQVGYVNVYQPAGLTVLEALRQALVLEAELRNHLKLPFVSSPMEPAYELVESGRDSGVFG